MKERPILFNGAMVRAILSGTKTQTRRVVKPQPADLWPDGVECYSDARGPFHVGLTDVRAHFDDNGLSYAAACNSAGPIACPYGKPGDRLWVREAFAKVEGQTHPWIATDYRATYTHGDRLGDHLGIKRRWRPSIHMPREASRILLEIVSVRVERLQEISRGDAMAEGCPFPNMAKGLDPREWYSELWGSINGPGSWAANAWVWVVEFKRVTS